MSWKRVWRVVFSVLVVNLGWLAGAALPLRVLGPVLCILVFATFVIVGDYHTYRRKPSLGEVIFLAHLFIFTVAMLLAWGVRATTG